ncbi:MAG: hypothetical protein CMM52_14790 [Rhodospirillaceae bacterium]|nr:hypothetical protein [Rhodospirillaceae bacterium]|tara:strand:+ start:22679 stop:23425 length:747 start_codon:yes stop_codon:yes gene_type:complete
MTSSTPPADNSTKKSGTKAVSSPIISPDSVAAFLEQNPTFVNDRPELLASLIPPEQDHGGGIVDMQKFMLERLQAELSRYQTREQNLLDAAEANGDVQARVIKAVKALLDANSFEALIKVVLKKLPKMFEISAAALCLEAGNHIPEEGADFGIIVVEPGTLESLMDQGRAVALRSDIEGDKAIFGSRASKVRSAALLRLNFGPNIPNGLLALGAKAPTGFDPRQGTELLSFFSYVLQRTIQRWLTHGK